MTFTIKNEELAEYNKSDAPQFPKYTSQLINWANQNAQGTRPKVVGQLSDVFPAYQKETGAVSIEGWENWYLNQYPHAIDEATEKIFAQVENLKGAIGQIDKEMVRRWVKDLVITKTYNGLYVQEAILARMAEVRGVPYRMAAAAEEAQGIDGYVGDTAYSIKSSSYKTMNRLPEEIPVKMVYYTKKKTGLLIEAEE